MKMTTTKTNHKIRQTYLDWLYCKIEEKKSYNFKEFIFEIDAVEFHCLIPNDDNRAEDGLQLRNQFADEQDYDLPDDALSGPCTVLEMLIALATRMDFILFDPAKNRRIPMWFWLFINNLKLQKYVNNEEDATRKKKFNWIVLNKFAKREYQADGRGGLFPLNSPDSDQRNVEIWYQMMDYIGENYDI